MMREYTDDLNLNGDADQFNALTVGIFATDSSRPILVCVEGEEDSEIIAGLLVDMFPEESICLTRYGWHDAILGSGPRDGAGGDQTLLLSLPAEPTPDPAAVKVAFERLDGPGERPASIGASTLVLFLHRKLVPILAESAPQFYASRYGSFFFLRPDLLVCEDGDEVAAAPANARPLFAFTLAEHNERIATFEAVLRDLANGPQPLETSDLEGTLKLRLGMWLLWMDRLDEAEVVLRQVLALARGEGEFEDESAAINNLALVFQAQGRGEEALALFEEDLQLCVGRGDITGEAKTLNNLGNSYSALGRWDEAVDCLNRSVKLKGENGDWSGQNSTLAGLANVFAAQGRWQKALEFHRESLALSRSHGFRIEEAIALRSEAEVYLNFTRKFQKAIDLLQGSRAIFGELELTEQEAGVFEWLGYAYSFLENGEESRANYERALTLWRLLGDQAGQARALSGIGGSHEVAKRWAEAIDCFQQALVLTRETEDRTAQAQVQLLLGRIFLQQGSFESAIQSFESSAKLFRAVGEPNAECEALGLQARAHQELSQWKEAEACTGQALALCRSTGDKANEGLHLTCLAQMKEEQSLPIEALALAKTAVEVLALTLERDVLADAEDIVARLDNSPDGKARGFWKKFTKR